jgi:hypothetical protein
MVDLKIRMLPRGQAIAEKNFVSDGLSAVARY